MQKLIFVAPHKEHFEQLELQIAALRFTSNGDAYQVGRLIVESVGHVKIGFRQRIALIERHRRVARDRIVNRDRPRLHRRKFFVADARRFMSARFFHHKRRIILGLQRTHRLRLGRARHGARRCLEGRA